MEHLFERLLGPKPTEALEFSTEDLTWAVMALLPDLVEQEGFESLRAYLLRDPRGRKLLGLSRRIAAALDQYPVYRPDMILGWEEGRSTDWQAVLHRAVVTSHGGHHVAARARDFLQTLQAEPDRITELPRRISLFGVSTLPPLYVDVLAALGPGVDVHLFLPSASPVAWDRIRREHGGPTTPSPAAEGHPLRATLGRLTDDFERVLLSRAAFDDRPCFGEPPAPDTAIHRLQAAIHQDLCPGPGDHPPADPDDRSITIHACHSALREVEVLHDQLRHLLEQDPTLSPDDVIVMAPDVESYAPYVEAVFASSGDASIPYRISDRRSRGLAPAAEAFLAVLDLARSRVTATEVLDLLAMDTVRRRFGLSVEDLSTIRRWVDEVGIRWGIDADHRQEWGLPPGGANTWRFGLDRLLLGHALTGERLFGGALPYDEIEGQASAVLGKLVMFCDLLFGLLRDLTAARPVATWVGDLGVALERLTSGDGEAAQQQQLVRGALAELGRLAARAQFVSEVDLEVVHTWLAAHLDESRSAHGFLGGGVTVCNLLPMRSVPFRVVCLLGMNDGEFPRSDAPSGFDRMADEPRIGDRSPRADDRHQFLEALLVARQHLVVTYVGRGIIDDAELPPSVLVSDLLDALASDLGMTDIVVRHPLQPFSPRYFQGDDRLVSYRVGYFEGARALRAERSEPLPFLSHPLPAEPPEELSLDDLSRFLQSPAAWLLQRRLGIRGAFAADALDEREPIQLDALQSYLAAQSMLAHAAGGGTPDDYTEVLHARGVLPHGSPGRCVARDIVDRVSPLSSALQHHQAGEPLPALDVSLHLEGVRLTGRLGELWPAGQLGYSAGRVSSRRLLALWVRHLALSCVARTPHYPRTSVLLARGPNDGVTVRAFAPLDERAEGWLADLVELYASDEPLPFFPQTSFAYAVGRLGGDGEAAAMAAARKEWWPGWSRDGEGDAPAVRRLFGDRDPLVEDGGRPGFRELALRVFEPLLSVLQEDGP